jgi:thiamine-phosphate pyrophosphorylase
MNREISGLYAITDETLLGQDHFSSVIEAVLAGGARVVQYRDKSDDLDRRLTEAQIVVNACKSAGVLSIINDDVELALTVGADGVHLGRSDQPLSYARHMLGATSIVGVSCYNRLDLAREAANNGADYVAVGSIYPSSTKPDAIAASIKDLTTIVEAVQLPVVAIGGITVDKLIELYSAGASSIAVVSGIFAVKSSEMMSGSEADHVVLNSIRNKAFSFSQEWSRCEQI